MAGFLGLKTSYALFIVALMVLGVVAGAFYFYNAAVQNPCGNPGNPQFSPQSNQTITISGQPKTYRAVAAKFTGTNQATTFANVTFSTTAFNNPDFPHLVNGNCVSDPATPVSITVEVKFSNTGLQESLAFAYGGALPSGNQTFTPDYQAGLSWSPGDPSLTLLVAA